MRLNSAVQMQKQAISERTRDKFWQMVISAKRKYVSQIYSPKVPAFYRKPRYKEAPRDTFRQVLSKFFLHRLFY